MNLYFFYHFIVQTVQDSCKLLPNQFAQTRRVGIDGVRTLFSYDKFTPTV